MKKIIGWFTDEKNDLYLVNKVYMIAFVIALPFARTSEPLNLASKVLIVSFGAILLNAIVIAVCNTLLKRD